jgi:hypothetical protein
MEGVDTSHKSDKSDGADRKKRGEDWEIGEIQWLEKGVEKEGSVR